MEGRSNFHSVNLSNGAEYGGNAADYALVIADAFQSGLKCMARIDRTQQDEDMFPADRNLKIVPEDDLSRRAVFRRHHVDRAVGVVGEYPGFCKFFSQISPDYFRTVQTDDRIHRSRDFIPGRQDRSNAVSFAAAGFHGGNIHVIRDMRL